MDIYFFLLSLIEIIYVIYMLRYFKTTLNFSHPYRFTSFDYLKHPVNILLTPQNTICKFGQDGALIIGLLIVLRFIFRPLINKKILLKINKYIVIIIFILSLMNFNAVVYLLPFYIYEIFLYFKLLKN